MKASAPILDLLIIVLLLMTNQIGRGLQRDLSKAQSALDRPRATTATSDMYAVIEGITFEKLRICYGN
jgi:hypothetical protein